MNMISKELLEQLESAEKSGDIDGQIEPLRQLLSLAQQSGNAVFEIEMLRQLGNAYQEKDLLQKAHSYRITAAKLAENPSLQCPQEEQMLVEGDLGRSYIEVKDWKNGEFHTLRAIKMAESLQNEKALCIYKMNLGLIFANTKHLQDAFKLGDEVLRTAERFRDHYILGLQHLNLASFLIHELRLNESQHHARQALAHADISGNVRLQMKAQYIMGQNFRVARFRTGRLEYSANAEHNLKQTIDLARKRCIPSLEADAELELGMFYEDIHQVKEAEIHYRRSIELLENVRNSLGYEEFHMSYFWSFEPFHNWIIEFFLRQGQRELAFLTLERLRSRLLLALLGKGPSDTRSWSLTQQNKLSEILKNYSEAVIQSFEFSTLGQRRGDTVGIRTEGDEKTSDTTIVCETRKSFLQLYESQKRYFANWQPHQSPPVIGFEDAQQFLGPDDALLSFLITDRSIVIFVATSHTHHFQHLAYPREKISDDVTELCKAMGAVQDQTLSESTFYELMARSSRDSWPKTIIEPLERLHRCLEKLYGLLVAPILAVINEKTHWVIIPHGPLHRVPWAALRGAGQYIVEHHSISLLPSASIGVALKLSKSSKANNVLFFAGPDLPAAQQEVKAICEFFRKGYAPFNEYPATKHEFLSRVPSAKLLHLACHHFFDASAPLLSFMKLSCNTDADFLYAFEVTELDLSAELVSLSACQSGRSRIATGDEQIGIVRAFLAAGARSIISTLWEIEDESACAFFTNFYKNACTFGLGKALSLTQRNLLRDPKYELPYFWAPYMLSGQYDKPLVFQSEMDIEINNIR